MSVGPRAEAMARVAEMSAASPRDAAFLQYWSSRIDLDDPAAPHWMDHFAERVRECAKMADTIERHRSLRGARALDIGCQTGALACVLGERGARVTGVDTTDWVLEAGRRRAEGWRVDATFQVARGEALPFEDRSFDVVTFVDVIEHCEDSTRCLAEVCRVLAPGGVAYVLGPNRLAPEWFVSDPHYHLLGASVLSPKWGRRYVEWRRGRPGYDIGVFPIGTHVAEQLRGEGLSIVESPVTRAGDVWRTWFKSSWAESGVPLARAWGVVRLAFIPTFVIVARREQAR
jgi:SAM-dependent methyltransferase